MNEVNEASRVGGEGGIRTPETLSGLRAFQARALDHYATSPREQEYGRWLRYPLYHPLMEDNDLRRIAKEFDVAFSVAVRPKNGALAEVFILDDGFVLRGRKEIHPKEQVLAEYALLDEVRALTKLELPTLRRTAGGELAVSANSLQWILYPKIPGHVLGTWTELPKVSDADRKKVFSMMRLLHDETTGKISRPFGDATAYPKKMQVILTRVGHVLSPHAVHRLEAALKRVKAFSGTCSDEEHCFVHGDMHQGNAIVDDSGAIHGLVDCDFAHRGHPFEDLAYTVMMYLRPYDDPSFTFNAELYQQLLDWYGLHADHCSLFGEYLLLAALFDIDVFFGAATLEARPYYLAYQISMVQDLCARFSNSGRSDALESQNKSAPKFPVPFSEPVLALAAELNFRPEDVTERFVRGSGHGGQKINKTSSCVELTHEPTRIAVRVQQFREQHKNRIAAWKLLLAKLEEHIKGAESRRSQEQFKIRKQKARRSRKSKEKMLQAKKQRGDIKKLRRDIL